MTRAMQKRLGIYGNERKARMKGKKEKKRRGGENER